jgi:hypothetical protein
LGALPVGRGLDGDFLLPVADDEAFWIGLGAQSQGRTRVGLMVGVVGVGPTDALSGAPWRGDTARSLDVALHSVVAGIARPDGAWWVFSRSEAPPGPASGSVRLVLFGAGNDVAASATVTLTDYAMFGRLTGITPSPLDPNAGYKGWLLP